MKPIPIKSALILLFFLLVAFIGGVGGILYGVLFDNKFILIIFLCALVGAIGGAVIGDTLFALIGNLGKIITFDLDRSYLWKRVNYGVIITTFVGFIGGSLIFNLEWVFAKGVPSDKITMDALSATLFITALGTFLGAFIGAFIYAYQFIEKLDKSNIKELENINLKNSDETNGNSS